MALLDSESHAFSTNVTDYATYNVYNISSQVGTPSIGTATSTPAGPVGDNYMSLLGYNVIRRSMALTSNTFFTGFRLNFNSSNMNIMLAFQDYLGNTQISIIFNGVGGAAVYLGGSINLGIMSTGAMLGNIGAGTFPTTGWFYLEIGAVIASGTGGSVIIKRNGLDTVFSISGVNTQSQPTNNVSLFMFGGSWADASYGFTHYYLCDNSGPAPWNTFLGDVRVQSAFPTLNASVQFSPTGKSSNWQNASTVPPNPAVDYNSSSLTGAQDTYYLSSIDNINEIFGVNVKVLANKTDAGDRGIQTVITSGSTTSLGASRALSTTPNLISNMYETDPNTSIAWTIGAFTSLTAGYKISD